MRTAPNRELVLVVWERGRQNGKLLQRNAGAGVLQSQKCSTSDVKGLEEQNILSVRFGLKLMVPDSSTNRGYLKGNPAASL